MRFKCVSKRWRSLISDPDFAKSHWQRLKAGDLIPSQRIIIGSPLVTIDYQVLDCGIGGSGGDLAGLESHEPRMDYSSMGTIDYEELDCSIGSDDDEAVVEFDEPRKDYPPWKDSHILGSCDGLVCLVFPGRFLIYNPTTKESRDFPGPDIVQSDDIFRGFGYDSQSDDYKIVGSYFVNWQVAIFSLKSGSWRRIEVPQESYIDISRQGVYWKGALHWLVVDRSVKFVITSFDLLEEKFHQVLPVPADTDFVGLGIHGSSLFIFKHSLDLCLQVWIMEVWITNEYGRLWTKLFSVLTDRIPGGIYGKIPFAFTRSRKVFFRTLEHQMVLFNPEDNTCKVYPIQTSSLIDFAIYLETLVSPYLGSEPNVGLDLCSMNL